MNELTTAPYIVFGYGSLIFKPPPHVISQVPGYLKGFVRRFSQSSSDHRGTPQNPGRVVTLIHVHDWADFAGSDPFPEDDIVWGKKCIAYTIDPKYESNVKAYLDYREKDGYTVDTTHVYGIINGEEAIIASNATVYVGRKDNPSFGSEPLDDLAKHIWSSSGPSGRNKDYLYDLTEAVRRLAPESHDSHLFALEARLKELDKVYGET